VNKATLKFVSVNSVFVDTAYQRPLNQKRIERLRKAFTRGASKAISLSRRKDGSLYVYDGQHTLALHKAMGEAEIPACIVDGTQALEAKWFLLMNGAGVSKASQREAFGAGLVAGDDVSLDVKALLDMHGVTVASGGASKGRTSAIGSLKIWYKADGKRLARVMLLIDRCWAQEDAAWTQIVMRGVWDLASTPEALDELEVGIKKHKVTPRRVLDTASGMQLATGVPGGGSGYAKNALMVLARIK
jgi:hypothetical protein